MGGSPKDNGIPNCKDAGAAPQPGPNRCAGDKEIHYLAELFNRNRGKPSGWDAWYRVKWTVQFCPRGNTGDYAVSGVAARAGKVIEAETRGAEGNYVVMETADGRQQAYLHLLRSGSVRRGERVGAGGRIGSVGQTGNADGCHLHFELWTAPGRFTGGRATDPRPALERRAR